MDGESKMAGEGGGLGWQDVPARHEATCHPRLGGACEANGRVREGRRGSPVPARHDKGKGSRPTRSPDGRAGKVWRDGTPPAMGKAGTKDRAGATS